MIGKILSARSAQLCPRTVAQSSFGECAGIIVEVEAYAAVNDEAAHLYRPTFAFIEAQTRRSLCLFQLRSALDAECAGERGREWLCFDSRA